ncbi:MAG: hypothetical protein HUU41_12075 [Bryobacteraceae bacterium]|nr:hypothetical protein [Bryobacterales bacterium]MEB2360957.1 hypothetical protein [Bryobacterales bacterium]NUN01844.1 hypothetical protein [Bryobacteraceae bacterium]
MTVTFALRHLCLLTALVNIAGNVLLLALYPSIFGRLGVPAPEDARGFVLESVLSFTMGVVALLIFLNPSRAIPLLKIGIAGKGAYAVVTYYFFAFHNLDSFYLIFAAWDAFFVVVFLLYWIHLESPDLPRLQTVIHPGLGGALSKRAVILTFSLTGNGRKAVEQLAAGLRSGSYNVDIVCVRPAEPVFRFPMSLGSFVRIVVRALFRYPAQIDRLDVPRRDYDLVVVESPTWLLGMAAPVEAVFQDPENRWLFEGRDAAAMVVCRGAHRRSRAMMVRWMNRLGANVVSARGFEHEGREPRRLMSLWFYLIFRRPGFPPVLAEPRYGLSEKSLREIRMFGERLAGRPLLQPASYVTEGSHV